MNIYDKRRLSENPHIAPFFDDIDSEFASRAYNALSHSPERGGSLIRAEYAAVLIADKEHITKTIISAAKRGATVDSYWPFMLENWFIGYRSAIKDRYTDYLIQLSKTMSWFITGSANFPINRNEKKQRIADLKYNEINITREKMKNSFLKSALPFGDGRSIRIDDPDAESKIKFKIESLEKSISTMKLANLICRKHQKIKFDADKCANEISEKTTITKKEALELLKPSFGGKIKPFWQYSFTNSSAEIRRLKKRLETVAKLEDSEKFINLSFENGITVILNEESRIEINFPIKPKQTLIDSLKQSGFKYSPRKKTWVRKYTENALYSLNMIKKVLEKSSF